MKIVILTGNNLRHYWFARALSEQLEAVGIVFEEKRSAVSAESADEITLQHLQEREAAEQKYFNGDYQSYFSRFKTLAVKSGEVNSPQTFSWVKDLKPDALVLFGSSIIKKPYLSYFENRAINIHLGLSPYYRGTATNFWPLVNNEPECVGATIHLAILKVDAGAILQQFRPDIELGDGPHDIGCQVIVKGAQMMAEAVKRYLAGEIKPQLQPASQLKEGKLYKRDDFNAAAALKMRENFKQGMIENYLKNKEERDKKYPIICSF